MAHDDRTRRAIGMDIVVIACRVELDIDCIRRHPVVGRTRLCHLISRCFCHGTNGLDSGGDKHGVTLLVVLELRSVIIRLIIVYSGIER